MSGLTPESRLRSGGRSYSEGGGQGGERSRHSEVMSMKPRERMDESAQCAAAMRHASRQQCLLCSVNPDTSSLGLWILSSSIYSYSLSVLNM